MRRGLFITTKHETKPQDMVGSSIVFTKFLTRNTTYADMACRLVRYLVYKRGVGIRETVWVGVGFGKSTSVLVGLFLHAEPRRRGPLR